jgi:type II secretory pathway pseudopilin PulG
MRRRQGFTLVEMLVSMTLTIFILIIISEAFIAGLETFRQLKAIGDMEGGLRNAATILRNDLSADHFEGKRRLSDPTFWTVGPPQQGFFRVLQVPVPGGDSVAPIEEGTDADGLTSRRRVGHLIHFTSKSRGNRPENFFAASIGDPLSPLLLQTFGQADSRYEQPASAPGLPQPATYKTYNSQWEEVAYFLVATGVNANGTNLYALYRRQRLAVMDNILMNWGNFIVAAPGNGKAQLTNYSQISCEQHPANNNVKPKLPKRLYFNNPTDLTIPERRLANYVPVTDANGNATGADLLLTSVVSFDVQILTPSLVGAVPPVPATTPIDVPGGLFDTWSRVKDDQYDYSSATTKPVPAPLVINALKITIRVWDQKTEQSRQVTIYQDM